MYPLLIAPGGMLGRAWAQLLNSEEIAYEVTGRPTIDLTHPKTLDAIPWDRFDTVINCAAWTDVDGAEDREAEAMAVNGAGVGELARRVQGVFVHYSTDYVFPGDATQPYEVDAPMRALNAYGRSKAAGETAIRAADVGHLILRTSWLYAPWGSNFVRTVSSRIRADPGCALRVIDDQRGHPTSTQHLAQASLDLLLYQARGTLHVTDGGECTWFELAKAIAARISPGFPVDPCPSSEYPQRARRPAYSVLDLTPTEEILGPMPSWQSNLAEVLDEMDKQSGGHP